MRKLKTYILPILLFALTAPMLAQPRFLNADGYYINAATSLEFESVHLGFPRYVVELFTDPENNLSMFGEDAPGGFFQLWGIEGGYLSGKGSVGLFLRGGREMDLSPYSRNAFEGESRIRSMFAAGISSAFRLWNPMRDRDLRANLGIRSAFTYKYFRGDRVRGQDFNGRITTEEIRRHGVGVELGPVVELGFMTTERSAFLLHYQPVGLALSTLGLGGTALRAGFRIVFWK